MKRLNTAGLCDGSGERRWGHSCPGCDNCHPAPRPVAPAPQRATQQPERPCRPCAWCDPAIAAQVMQGVA